MAGSATDLNAALTDSVDLHLGADVPVALLLSAGVDSAAVAAASRRAGRDLNCLTVATGGPYDESDGAARTARHYGHHFQRVPAELVQDDISHFFAAMQRPSIDGLNTYLVCKAVREAGFAVALSGLGGDEAVGGYSHFRLLRFLPALRGMDRLPSALRDAVAKSAARSGAANAVKLRKLLAPDGPRDGRGLSRLQRELLPGSLVADLTGVRPREPFSSATRQETGAPERPFSAMVRAEVEIYLQAMLLPDSDCFSMASSVELRVPFVDSHVFAAARHLEASTGTRPGKKAFGSGLGDPYLAELARNPKRGFTLPMRRWMSGPLGSVLTMANEPDAALWSVLDRKAAERAGLAPLQPRDRWAETWAFAALNAWLSSVSGELGVG